MADDTGKVTGSVTSVEAAHLGARLTEYGVVGSDRQVADDVKNVAAANCISGHHCDYRLGSTADLNLQVEHVQPADAPLGHLIVADIAVVTTDSLVAARAEGLLALSGKDDHPNIRVVTCPVEAVLEFEQGLRPKGISNIGPIDGQLGDAIGGFVFDVGVFPGWCPTDCQFVPLAMIVRVTIACPRRRCGSASDVSGQYDRSMELNSWLSRNAASLPEHPALIEGDKTVSCTDLERRSTELAHRLSDLGVEEGDWVVVVAEPGSDYIYLIHALIGLGAQLVPLDPRLKEAEIETCLTAIQPRLTVRDPMELQASGKAHETQDQFSLRQTIELDSVHCLIHTSGSVGVPKPVELTYGNHLFSALGSASRLGVGRDDRWLLCLPLFHVSGLAIVMRSLIHGTTIVVSPRVDAGEIGRAIEEHRVTHISLVPTMLRRLMALPGAAGLDRLRVVLLGGGPMPPRLLEDAVERGIPVAPTYGLTESASQVATLAPKQAAKGPCSVGPPLMHTQVRIDGAGTILVRGPTVAPSEVGVDGWLRTGDLGRIDDAGYLHVLGRADSVIVTGGENVAPEEVEGVMIAHSDVDDVAVVGREDPEWQRAVIAKVVLRDGARAGEKTAQALRDFCRERMPGFKVPRRVEFVDVLPRSAQGKLKRQELEDA